MEGQRQFHLAGKKVWVAGHQGMVGQCVVQRLGRERCTLLLASREELDLRCQARVREWVASARPDVVIIAAAKVGGILANSTYPADFIYDNLMIEANIIHASARMGVEKLLFLGSSCIYPKLAKQPISEDQLLRGSLEPTNEWYAIAKIAGIKLCQAYRKQYGLHFISAMPTNLYGPGDNFDLETSHVIPALMRKMHDAKERGRPAVAVWGTGTPRREFLYVEDLADGLVFLLKHYDGYEHINIGSSEEVTIGQLGNVIKEVVGFSGQIVFDPTKPDGTKRKLLDVSRLSSLGWRHSTSLRDGLRKTYCWFSASSSL